MDADKYDAGLLNSHGGGDIGWWQDYIRAEIERCNDHWKVAIERDRKDREGRGLGCVKAVHKSHGGYLHEADYDGPYEVDGVEYCGRCHVTMYAHEKAHAPDPLSADLVRLAELVTGRTNCVWRFISWIDSGDNECHGLQFAKPEETYDKQEWFCYPKAAVAAALKEIEPLTERRTP